MPSKLCSLFQFIEIDKFSDSIPSIKTIEILIKKNKIQPFNSTI